MKKVVPVNMMGVVIYISKDRQRAIIWCEDHGPLAYVRGEKSLFRGEAEVAVGDCVRFMARTDGDFRIGTALEPIMLPPVSGLANALKARATRKPPTPGEPNVIYPEFTKERRYG